MVKLIANRPHTYDKQRLGTDEKYEATEEHAKLLVALGTSRLDVQAAAKKTSRAPPPKNVNGKRQGRYNRRDMRAMN